MKFSVLLSLALIATSLVGSSAEQEQQQRRILRRVIKSTPTATTLGRVRLVTVRAAGPAEKGAVSEISSKEAATFGQRSSNETSVQTQAATKSGGAPSLPAPASKPSSITTTTSTSSPRTASTSTTSTTTVASNTSAAPASSTPAPIATVPKASERLQAAAESEVLSGAQSTWQMMTAVEAPAAALIAAGTRAASQSQNDLQQSSSEYTLNQHNDFLRSGTKNTVATSGQTYSSLRQNSAKTRQQQQQHQQSFFYPQQQQLRQGKTSNYQATKTQWYQTTSTTTTPRPAPLIQEPQYEQYVEQQVDSAPPGQAEPFAFDFNTQDTSGNGQYRKEESDNNGVVRGSYGFRDASGLYRHVDYVADHNGFRANIRSNEPGLEGGKDAQPASIKLDNGPAPAQSSRVISNDNGEWTSEVPSAPERANLALAPPDFESSHKPERIRGN